MNLKNELTQIKYDKALNMKWKLFFRYKPFGCFCICFSKLSGSIMKAHERLYVLRKLQLWRALLCTYMRPAEYHTGLHEIEALVGRKMTDLFDMYWIIIHTVNRTDLAWVGRRERSCLGLVGSRPWAPRLSWGAPGRPGSFGQRPGPFSPSPMPSRPTCTPSRSGRRFPGRTRCKDALCLKRGTYERRKRLPFN